MSTASDAEGGRPGDFPSIVVRGDALEQIEAVMAADPQRQLGGVLVGNAAPSTNFVLIAGFIPAPTAADDADEFALAADDIDGLNQQVAARYPGQRIVGWYHSRPGEGVFLAEADVRTHQLIFPKTWHVAYVFDPADEQRGFFGWRSGSLARLPHWEVTASMSGVSAELPVLEEGPIVDDDPGLADLEPVFGGSPSDEGGVDESGAISGIVIDAEAESEHDGVADGSGHIAAPALTIDDSAPRAVSIPRGRSGPSARAIIGIAAAAIVALIVIVVAVGGDDDPDDSATTTSTTDPSNSSNPDEETTTTPAESTTSTPGAAIDPNFPGTPSVVQPPQARVGAGSTICQTTASSTYEPVSDCYVPLANGNIVAFVAGSLRCVDPANTVLAAEAQAFTIGTADSALAITADGDSVGSCADSAYVRNVIADGAATLDGLCGSSGTQINEGTARCIGHNPTTGAIGAVMRSGEVTTEMTGTCWAAGDQTTVNELTWSDPAVSSLWRVDGVDWDVAGNSFVIRASRDGATATAGFLCA